MNLELKAVHFNFSEQSKEYVDKKMERLAHVENIVEHLHLTATKEKHGFKLQATVHYHHGKMSHLEIEMFEVAAGIDIMFDKLEELVTREKKRIQEHK